VRPGHQPDAGYFAVMADHAADHWWYRSRRSLMALLLDGAVPAGGTALDVGCGTGETMALLRRLGATTVAGTDLSDDALAHARRRGGTATAMAALAEQLPFADACADVLVSTDVLEHLDDDRRAVREYGRVLKPGGRLLVTVPAYGWLWSAADDRAGHRRRYARHQLAAVVAAEGFTVDRATHFFSFLVPPAVVIRKTPLGRLTADTDEDASGGPLVGRVLSGLAAAERRVLRRHRIPIGLSMVVLATRDPAG
jgi:SAM-dependent methyltransferase